MPSAVRDGKVVCGTVKIVFCGKLVNQYFSLFFSAQEFGLDLAVVFNFCAHETVFLIENNKLNVTGIISI